VARRLRHCGLSTICSGAKGFATTIVIAQVITTNLHSVIRFAVAAFWVLLAACLMQAGLVAAASAPDAAAKPQGSAPGAPAAVPLGDLPSRSETVLSRLKDIETHLETARVTLTVVEDLPALSREIDARWQESAKILAQRPSLEMLRTLDRGWLRSRATLAEWGRDLVREATQLDRHITELNELEKTWQETLRSAQTPDTPAEVRKLIERVIGAVRKTREDLQKRRAEILTVQNRVARQDARIEDVLAGIGQARDTAISHLFVREEAPIWSANVRARLSSGLFGDMQRSLSVQFAALRVYAHRQTGRFALHTGIFIALAVALYWTRRRIRRVPEERVLLVFEFPIATALVLPFLASRWIYPQAPRLLWAILGAIALIPTIVILGRITLRRFVPILHVLIGFYFVDQLRAVAASLDLVPRLLFLGEMLAGIAFLAWLLRRIRTEAPAPDKAEERVRKLTRAGARLALAFLFTTFTANALGYVALANLLGNAALSSAYFGIILYALVTILDALSVIALHTPPLALFAAVERHADLIRHRMRRIFQWLAAVMWTLFVLERLSLREPLLHLGRTVFNAEITQGSLHISLSDILAFGIAVWASFLVSRFIRFILEEDVYPRVHLSRGLPYAISTVVHYLILLVGFFIAMAALGVDMTKFTILAGAFTVGVGFGLQNIFNNFVSGLILLFERPVKVGDVVQIGDTSGTVERIGIRASLLRTPTGSDIIVPNGKLISEQFINWTLSSRQRGIEIPITVSQAIAPEHVIALLKRVASVHPLVSKNPPPDALVVKLGADAVSYELQVWTDRIEQWMQVRSALSIAISTALSEEKIALK
jgi:potassium-dependent mechanosensitive channel